MDGECQNLKVVEKAAFIPVPDPVDPSSRIFFLPHAAIIPAVYGHEE